MFYWSGVYLFTGCIGLNHVMEGDIIISQVSFARTIHKDLTIRSISHYIRCLLRAVVSFPCDVRCFLIGRACRVCRIWLDRVVFCPYSIEPDSAYRTGTTNQQTGSKTITPIAQLVEAISNPIKWPQDFWPQILIIPGLGFMKNTILYF